MSTENRLAAALAQWEQEGLLRLDEQPRPTGVWDVSSNDYLGYACSPVSRETLEALSGYPAGAGASRLIHGTHEQHQRLESELAAWVGLPAALAISSGYAANVGLLGSVAAEGDLIVSDALNHASIIDGCRLSRARVEVAAHRDLKAFERALDKPASARWVVTESYFSMDGQSPDLAALRALCDRFGAGLIVDEAHAIGVFGPSGAGLCRSSGVAPDVLVGTLGKAVGVQGAFIAGSAVLRRFLWNRTRSVVFSTGVSPLLAALVRDHVARIRADEASRDRLSQLCAALEARLASAGVALPEGRHGPIFPILLGSPDRAVRAAAELRECGFLAQAIRPPTVPPNTCRLRITLSSRLPDAVVEDLARALIAVAAP